MSRPALTIMVDGECPLCREEGAFLERLDDERGRLAVVDAADPAFDAAAYGLEGRDLMGQIHGVTAEGEIVRGMEVFRRAYGLLGWGWVLAPTAWPGLKPLFDRFYRWFAANRMRLTGRSEECAERCLPPEARSSPPEGQGSVS